MTWQGEDFELEREKVQERGFTVLVDVADGG
jgi:hypothetical protein